jgi:lipoprotein-releasing system ATP-binding protein
MEQITYPSDTAVAAAREARSGMLLDSFLAFDNDDSRSVQREPTQTPSQDTTPLLTAKRLFKSYRKSKHIIPVLRGVDFCVQPGEFVAVVGQSGSGKSTLLHLLGTLDEPDAGEIHFERNRIDNLPMKARDVLRNKYFGMIFQFYHLLPELTTMENVLAPRMISDGVLRYWFHRRKHAEQATQLLEMVGLSHRTTHKPRELSGGEMQRAAIARALIAEPQLLLADEPTGNLDRKTGQEIMDLLRTLNRRQNLTIVMVTHDNAIAALADRTVRLVEGLVERIA